MLLLCIPGGLDGAARPRGRAAIFATRPPDHPDADIFLEHQTQFVLDQSYSKLIAAAFLAAQRLVDVINNESNRGYVVFQAVESLFRNNDRGITDRENAEQLKEIKESLSAL